MKLRRSSTLIALLMAILLVFAGVPVAADNSESAEVLEPLIRIDGGSTPAIVNGSTTSGFPSVVELLDSSTGTEFCTGTLIGCETVLTAASCVCSSSGANCQAGGPDVLDPTEIEIFAQHAGYLAVSSIEIPTAFELGIEADVAILRLTAPVEGIAPATINTLMTPAIGTSGEIVGFGETQGDEADNGIKRHGQVVTSTCTQVPGDTHVCWLLEDPLGEPGSDSGSCNGDSGGPLFVDLGDGPVIAGVTSGGFNPTCLPDLEAFDSDVFVNRSWIQTIGGADLANETCGDIAQAGTPSAAILGGEGVINSFDRNHTWRCPVPPATAALQVTLNGEDGTDNDFDLYVKYGVPPTFQDYDCASWHEGTTGSCDFQDPTPGLWYCMASWFAGGGLYQLTSTPFGPEELIFSDGFATNDTRRWSETEPP